MPRGGNKQKLLNEREGKRQPAGNATSMGSQLYDSRVWKKNRVDLKKIAHGRCFNY